MISLSVLSSAAQSFSSPGTLDPSFDPPLRAGAAVYVVALQTNGEILIGGAFATSGSNSVTNVARLNQDGSVDPTFNPGTAANRGYISAIATQPDGKILIGGYFNSTSGAASANLARLNFDGSVDGSFDPGLSIDDGVNAVLLQSDGKVLFGGAFQIVDFYLRRNIARVNADGKLDLTFDACVAAGAGSGATALA